MEGPVNYQALGMCTARLERCTDMTLVSVSLYRKWETVGTVGSYYLSEKQILGCGQSSWSGPPLPTLLDPGPRSSVFRERGWCCLAKAALMVGPPVLPKSLQLLPLLATQQKQAQKFQ